jgi:PII-like signaling protein
VKRNAVKLTSYFGERQRVAGDGFAADALLDLYGRHGVAASILLRGAEGFGAKRHPRTDRSLTLSEDLPLIAVAVDSRSKIEPLVDPTARITGTGLVTLERARLLRCDDSTGEIEPVTLRDEVHEETKLTIYLGRQERVYRVPAFMAVCDLLHRRGVAGATALLGVDGTAHGQRQRASFFSRNSGTPMMVIAVGSGERIGRVLPELGGLLRRPLLTLEQVRICKRDGQLLAVPSALPGTDETGLPVLHKLMVYTSEAALDDGRPVHRAIVGGLRAAGLAGATTLRGVWGFHGDHAPHGDRLLQLGRHVPVVTVVIDSPERIAVAFEVIDALTTKHGLVTSETVPAVRPGGDGRGQYVLRRLLTGSPPYQ